METIEVILLNYRFRFRRLYWKEEFELQAKGRDERRVLLAAALVEVSDFKVNNFDEAWRLMAPDVLPTTILHRVFLIYKGKQPETRMFATRNLYKAPEPTVYGDRITEETSEVEQRADAAIQRMEQQFGKKELEEAAEVDRQILHGAKTKTGFRGAVPKHLDEEDMAPMGGFKVKKPNA